MQREKMKIAVIGCGRFSRFFIPLWKAHPVVGRAYVCDLRKEREEAFAKEFGVERVESFEAALASPEINAVAIFTQRYAHGQMVIRALLAGKHVYSAVPCATDIADIKEIAALVKKTRLTYSMGETGFYRAPAIYCRQAYKKGTFGTFVYGEAQYNHDIRNMEESFKSSGGDDWKRYAGIPPMFYPTHSTSMLLSALPGVHAVKVAAMGFAESPRTDIYGTNGQNLYENPFACTTMLLTLSNGGILRVSENRCVGWRSPETYISQFYGSEGGYEFSVANHYQSQWDPARPGLVTMRDITESLQPASVTKLIKEDHDRAVQEIADGMGFFETSPVQPTAALPKEFAGLENGHNGTHHFLIDDFCRAYATGKLSPTNIWQAARYNIPGLVAHRSALAGGVCMDVEDLGDAPADWEVLDWEKRSDSERVTLGNL